MYIEIKQKRVAVGAKYEIIVDGTQTYYAKCGIALLPEIEVCEVDGTSVLSIKKRFSFITARYSILLKNGNSYSLQSSSLWKPAYMCAGCGDAYEIYGHRNNQWSIFKGLHQVASFEKDSVSIAGGDRYVITADYDAEISILTAIVLSLDTHHDLRSGSSSTVNVDMGTLIEGKKCDHTWRPRRRKI